MLDMLEISEFVITVTDTFIIFTRFARRMVVLFTPNNKVLIEWNLRSHFCYFNPVSRSTILAVQVRLISLAWTSTLNQSPLHRTLYFATKQKMIGVPLLLNSTTFLRNRQCTTPENIVSQNHIIRIRVFGSLHNLIYSLHLSRALTETHSHAKQTIWIHF